MSANLQGSYTGNIGLINNEAENKTSLSLNEFLLLYSKASDDVKFRVDSLLVNSQSQPECEQGRS